MKAQVEFSYYPGCSLEGMNKAFRAYDPCYACATHTLPGQMPLDIKILSKDGILL